MLQMLQKLIRNYNTTTPVFYQKFHFTAIFNDSSYPTAQKRADHFKQAINNTKHLFQIFTGTVGHF